MLSKRPTGLLCLFLASYTGLGQIWTKRSGPARFVKLQPSGAISRSVALFLKPAEKQAEKGWEVLSDSTKGVPLAEMKSTAY